MLILNIVSFATAEVLFFILYNIIYNSWTDFPGGFGGFKPPQGRVNTPPENVETPPKNLETPPEILLIFNIPNYSLDYFTTMKLF